MRLPVAILTISFAIICTSLAATQQSEPLAEQQFKNIVSFKGQKAGDLIPAMEFINASLNVNCSYCHVQDRSSDEKEEKRTAREMIAMQKSINDKSFNGRTVVTCATCHAGHTHPVPVPPVIGSDIRARRSADVTPDQVLGAYAKALSADAATTTTTTTLHLIGKTTTKGETSSVEATYAGEKFYELTHLAKGDQKQGFNGQTVWFTRDGKVQTVPIEYAIQFIRENAIFLSADTLPKLERATGGTSKVAGKDTLTVSGTISGSTSRATFFFDKQTGLLVRSTYSYPTILGSILQINEYSDYRKVHGIQVPTKIVNHSSEGDTIQEYSRVNAETKTDVTVFDPPKKTSG